MGVIIASSKPWHKQRFEAVSTGMVEPWLYVETPGELEDAARCLSPRFIFFLHWNWKVSPEMWKFYNCVCFHMTDLPYGRGGSPLQNLILNGKSETVVSALRMVDEMDAGPIYGKHRLSLEGRAEEIYLRAGEICWKMIDEIIEKDPMPTQQIGAPTYFKRRKPEDSRFPLSGTLENVYDFIRMLDAPTYPLAYIDHGEFRLEFSKAKFDNDEIEALVVLKKRVIVQ